MNTDSHEFDTAQDRPGSHLRMLDWRFGQWARRYFAGDGDADALERLARAVSFALGKKHTCLDLERVRELGERELESLITNAGLEQLPTPGAAGNNSPLLRSGCGRYVWMQKYFHYEQGVANRLRRMAVAPSAFGFDQGVLERRFADLTDSEEQQQAVRLACTRRLAIITGGPGTGKTWTVANLIQVLLDSNPSEDIRIGLAAPTGKAAYRVHESLQEAMENLHLDDGRFPNKARTLHSLLKFNPNAPRPRRNAENPLDLDMFIVDEASMIGLPMMVRVLDALPDEASLVLLGDKDQLSSVQAGSVMADLCDTASPLWEKAEESPVALLTVSRRFTDESGIGAWARAVNANRFENIGDNGDVTWLKPNASAAWEPEWIDGVVEHFKGINEAVKNGTGPLELLKKLQECQVLCALNQGPYGVSGINEMIARKLGRAASDWAPGVPVMVTHNDRTRGVYNGDVGLVLPVRESEAGWAVDRKGTLMACFPGTAEDGGIRVISAAQMPPHAPCYAMTVHKSQGSEYGTVVLVLPADSTEHQPPQVLTRELVYTGVTRAKNRVIVSAGEEILKRAVGTPTVRMSGLAWHGDHSGANTQA